MTEIFSYDFFNNALLAAVFTSITCGFIGTYVVTRRIVFISGGITHTSFGGIGLGYFAGINPLLGAAIFSLLSAFGIEYASKRSNIREDSAIAIMWSFGMAIGIIFIYLTPGYAPNLMTYLFGSILTVSFTELFLIGLLALINSLIFSIFYRGIIALAFDEDFAKTRNIPATAMSYLLIGLVALSIVISIKVAGIILIISLLTIPQATANLLVKDFRKIIFLSIIFGLIGSIIGLLLSYHFNVPSGATIIFTLVLIFGLVRIAKIWNNS